jgi:hypothetical protein
MFAAPDQLTETSPRKLGRAIALLFIVTLVLGIVAQGFISERLISFRDPARTASNILANEALYAAGFTLKPVNRRIATLALVFGIVGCTVKTFSRVFYLVPLIMLKQGALGALTGEQLEAMSLVLLNVNDRGAGVALAFFGFETVLEGWLILRSTFLPRWLGAMTIVAGIGWLTFLSPTLGYAVFNVVALIALVGLITSVGWLLVKGVDEERWRALAALSAS